jgi:hypothetical protein
VLEVFGAGAEKANGMYYDAYDKHDGKPQYIKVGGKRGVLCECIKYSEEANGGTWYIWVKGGIAYSVETKGTEARPPSTGWGYKNAPFPRFKWLDDEEGYDKNFFMC